MADGILAIAGDPIQDIYIATNKNGKTTSYETKSGGAHNVFENALSILGFQKVLFLPSFFKENKLYKILRLNSKKEIHLCNFENKKDWYRNYLGDFQYASIEYRYDPAKSGMILSDYDKGVLNRKNIAFEYDRFDKIKFIVADTKYRSLNTHYLSLAKTTIWRCTGKEYNEEFALNFDFVIWTDGEKPIKFLCGNGKHISTIPFEPVEAKDTCGAGDTFTAALSSYLFEAKELSESIILKAIYFAIDCSQEVVQIDKTAITTQKLY